MATKLTKATQMTAVAEGLAVGCLELGHTELPANKMKVEFAFRVAWRVWPHRSQFPTVKTGPADDDIYYQIMGRSARRRGAIAYWDMSRVLRPTLLTVEDVDDALELIAQFYSIPAEDWVELTRVFTDELLH
jgi:hypothetical protein